MRYFSEKTGKFYDSEIACVEAEKKYDKQNEELEKKKERRKAKAKEVDEKAKAYSKALKEFCDEFGPYHKTVDGSEVNSLDGLFDLLTVPFWF